jgi:hypothetical protein
MRYEEATLHHPSAQGATATRNPDAERGVGRAFRHEPNMLPQQAAALRVQKAGMSDVRSASIGRAVQSNKDLIGQPGRLSVAVRSGNGDPTAIGLSKSNWGLASIGDDVPATAPTQSKLFLIGGIAALAAVFLLMRKPARS